MPPSLKDPHGSLLSKIGFHDSKVQVFSDPGPYFMQCCVPCRFLTLTFVCSIFVSQNSIYPAPRVQIQHFSLGSPQIPPPPGNLLRCPQLEVWFFFSESTWSLALRTFCCVWELFTHRSSLDSRLPITQPSPRPNPTMTWSHNLPQKTLCFSHCKWLVRPLPRPRAVLAHLRF